jgi:hypothetical protein
MVGIGSNSCEPLFVRQFLHSNGEKKMSSYTPDRWAIIKINGTDPHYRIFGTWIGGYLNGDSWRLNSGIVKVEEDTDNDCYMFYGSSGSVYCCFKNNYGFTGWSYGVAENIAASNGELLESMPDVLNLEYV